MPNWLYKGRENEQKGENEKHLHLHSSKCCFSFLVSLFSRSDRSFGRSIFRFCPFWAINLNKLDGRPGFLAPSIRFPLFWMEALRRIEETWSYMIRFNKRFWTFNVSVFISRIIFQHSRVRLRPQPRQAVDPAGDRPNGADTQEVHGHSHDEETADAAVHRRGHWEGEE